MKIRLRIWGWRNCMRRRRSLETARCSGRGRVQRCGERVFGHTDQVDGGHGRYLCDTVSGYGEREGHCNPEMMGNPRADFKLSKIREAGAPNALGRGRRASIFRL